MIQAHYRDAVALSARTGRPVFIYPGKRAGRTAGSSPTRRQLAGAMAAPVADSLATGFCRTPAMNRLPGPATPVYWSLALPAPPWGSVWLDKENVLFGDSTLALREWMRANGIGHAGAEPGAGRSFRHAPAAGRGLCLRVRAGGGVFAASRPAPVSTGPAASSSVYRRGRAPLLSTLGQAGSGDPRRMAAPASHCRRRQTALSLNAPPCRED